tara:strand:- start:722 stop:859 length:138 start_codon:yes stop_codon:yes gene_type:complete
MRRLKLKKRKRNLNLSYNHEMGVKCGFKKGTCNFLEELRQNKFVM